jgi:hypothetical protein
MRTSNLRKRSRVFNSPVMQRMFHFAETIYSNIRHHKAGLAESVKLQWI